MKKSDAGFTLLSTIGAIAVFLLLLPILYNLAHSGSENIQKRAVVDHFQTIERAVRCYAKLNHNTLIASATNKTGPAVTMATLKTSGCLPMGTKEKNAWGQSYNIAARKDANGRLAMVITTNGGRTHTSTSPRFGNAIVPSAAALGRIGFIPTGDIHPKTLLKGAFGAWEVKLADIGITATPGHLGMISLLSADDLAQDFLYRVEVPGHPELNAMQTTLDMRNNNIASVKTLSFTPTKYTAAFCKNSADEGKTFLDPDQGLYLCRKGQITIVQDSGNSMMMQDAQLAVHDQIIAKPPCPKGANLVPQIFVAPSVVSAGAKAPTMAAIQAWAVDMPAPATSWKIQVRILTADNKWVYPGQNYGKVVVNTMCVRQ